MRLLLMIGLVALAGCGAEDLIRDLIVTRLVSPENGASGTDGIDGVPGVDGEDGQDGIDGAAGIDGTDGIDGSDGTNGSDGEDGLDGNTDGFSELLESCWVECPPNFNDPCEIVCPETDESATRLTPADAVPKP